MELMHQPLIRLADRMRTSYGEHGLLCLLRMVAAVRSKIELHFRDETPMPEFVSGSGVTRRWPEWFHLTPQGKLEQAQGLATLKAATLMSRETAVSVIAGDYDVADPAAELARIKTNMAEEDQRETEPPPEAREPQG
jgi:hypothetical protein